MAQDDRAGFSVASAGDVNGDGFDDIVIGARFADPGGTNSGASYVIYGNDFRLEADKVATAGADILIGTQGQDTIDGAGGGDVINAGAGDDIILVGDKTFFRIDGGGGTDTLTLDYAGAIDFGDLDGNALSCDRGRIAGIEVIDVANGETNALTLHKAEVLDIDCQAIDTMGIPSVDNLLVINGESGDTLQRFSADNWDPPDTTMLLGYVVLTSGNVRVAIDNDIVLLTPI